MEHPDRGGWGGRYEFYLPQKVPIFGKKEKYPIWTNANDTVPDGRGGFVTGNHATIWRWREAVQNDFLARLRWTEVSEFEKAVHAPVVRLATPSVPDQACTLHVVLEVTNEGTLGVTRYARVILNVKEA